ncbi:hypothetical protein C8F04DRAFT_455689 [Mycena alexandri]|uniref:Uncharacterized protein n=1 Tax=Mycena alexandri TaxID=1745969 RepID=A0AAD6TIK3_9AGAR|nr:hypothetical protein C8F04DRAFT_455689 [Mycena alexandri]
MRRRWCARRAVVEAGVVARRRRELLLGSLLRRSHAVAKHRLWARIRVVWDEPPPGIGRGRTWRYFGVADVEVPRASLGVSGRSGSWSLITTHESSSTSLCTGRLSSTPLALKVARLGDSGGGGGGGARVGGRGELEPRESCDGIKEGSIRGYSDINRISESSVRRLGGRSAGRRVSVLCFS